MENHSRNIVGALKITIHTLRELNCEGDVLDEIHRAEQLEQRITDLIREQSKEGGYLHSDGLSIRVSDDIPA